MKYWIIRTELSGTRYCVQRCSSPKRLFHIGGTTITTPGSKGYIETMQLRILHSCKQDSQANRPWGAWATGSDLTWLVCWDSDPDRWRIFQRRIGREPPLFRLNIRGEIRWNLGSIIGSSDDFPVVAACKTITAMETYQQPPWRMGCWAQVLLRNSLSKELPGASRGPKHI